MLGRNRLKPSSQHIDVRLVVAGLLLILAQTPVRADHPKTDLVTLDDGGSYIGEIKGVQAASLSLHTNAAGTISIEWRHVTGLTSEYSYRIELTGDVLHIGSLGPGAKPGYLNIVGAADTTEVALFDVFQISPIEHSFWRQLDGSVNFGFSYTQANQAVQYNVTGDGTYRTRRSFFQLSVQSIFNTQKGGNTTNQQYLKLVLSQLTSRRWGPFELGQLQANPDQGFDLRVLLGGGITYWALAASREMLSMNLGAVYNREDVTDSPDVDKSAAALLGVSFQRFKTSSHSPLLKIALETFTNITDTPRFRFQFIFNISWKIVGDLTVGLQVNDNYDSRPPGTDSNKNDLVLNSNLGLTF